MSPAAVSTVDTGAKSLPLIIAVSREGVLGGRRLLQPLRSRGGTDRRTAYVLEMKNANSSDES